MTSNTLPVILVSAEDLPKAKCLISDLVDNQWANTDNIDSQESLIWRLQNKYYFVNVRLYPLADNESVPKDILNLVEAHIVYISDKESDVVIKAEKRASISKDVHSVDVHLLLYEGSNTPSALTKWACNSHYEVVPLKEIRSAESEEESDADDDLGPFKETYGMERVRETLHSHTWSGLQRIDIPAQVQSFERLALSSDEDWVGEEEEEEGDETEEAVVERAEAFAVALEAIWQAQAARGEGDDDSRRRRAEGAVAALRHALGADFDRL